jgi:hypothetical protein
VLATLSRWRSRVRIPSGPRGEVAQLAEHAAENRGVGSSILPLATHPFERPWPPSGPEDAGGPLGCESSGPWTGVAASKITTGRSRRARRSTNGPETYRTASTAEPRTLWSRSRSSTFRTAGPLGSISRTQEIARPEAHANPLDPSRWSARGGDRGGRSQFRISRLRTSAQRVNTPW